MNTRFTTTLALTMAMALLLSVVAVAQKITSLNASAKGKGTITISDLDKHEITSVLVILKEGGEADLTFYADLQLAAQGTWSLGNRKLFLRKDGKSIEKLNIQATSADGSKVTVEFVADKDTPKEN